MNRIEVLCSVMDQHDFSKIHSMNIQTDAIISNQTDCTDYNILDFDSFQVKMVSTDLRGIGNSRNIALTYATKEICLLADDDVIYTNDYQKTICNAFDELPMADMIIFNLQSSGNNMRTTKLITACKKMRFFSRNPYGACHVAFRLKSQRKFNIWFNTLFGGGCIYPSGEDSMFINEFRKKGNVYLYPKSIGTVDFTLSTWFKGYKEYYYFGKGALCAAAHGKTVFLWKLYYSIRENKGLSFSKRFFWLNVGAKAFSRLQSYDEWCKLNKKQSDLL